MASNGNPLSNMESGNGSFLNGSGKDKAVDQIAEVSRDLVGKNSAESGFPIMKFLNPLVNKTFNTPEQITMAAQLNDPSEIKATAWEVMGTFSSIASGVLGGLKLTTKGTEMMIESVLVKSAKNVLLPHLYDNSKFSSMLTGVLFGEPFYSFKELRNFKQIMDSSAFAKLLHETVQASLDGAINAAKFTPKLRELFSDMKGRGIFRVPEIPAKDVIEGLKSGVKKMPGSLSDYKQLTTVGNMVETIKLPPLLSLMALGCEARSAKNSWQEFVKKDGLAAKGEVLAACFTSCISATGAAITALPLTGMKVSPAVMRSGQVLMIGGALGNLGLQQFVTEKS